MLFFSNEQDYKNVVSGLRRELKAMGLAVPSHTEMLEAVAKSMGHKGYAALRAAQPPAVSAVVPSSPTSPVPEPLDADETRRLADLALYQGYRLFNTTGQLDLAPQGGLVDGLEGVRMRGTCDDIFGCAADVLAASRAKAGALEPEYAGETEVNWDDQETRRDSRGVPLYIDESWNYYPADALVIVPASTCDGADLFTAADLPVRSVLVDACKRWLVDNRLAPQALEELSLPSSAAVAARAVDGIGRPGETTSVLGQAQWVAGFAMHLQELVALRGELVTPL